MSGMMALFPLGVFGARKPFSSLMSAIVLVIRIQTNTAEEIMRKKYSIFGSCAHAAELALLGEVVLIRTSTYELNEEIIYVVD